MKRITFAGKSVLVGDEAADVLLAYGAALTRHDSGDTVHLKAINADGNVIEAGFLLPPGSSMMTETTNSDLPAPDNEPTVAYMLEQIEVLNAAAGVRMDEPFPDEDGRS
jgi:hypothetical protein